MTSFNVSMVLSVIDRASAPVRQASQAIRTGVQSIGAAAREANQSMAKLGDVSQSLSNVGKSLSMRVTLPIAGFGGVVLKMAGDFELSMNKLSGASRASGSEIAALKAQAMELGSTTQYSASQAATAMNSLAMAGFKTNDILAAMPGTLQLASAAQLDLGAAAGMATNVLFGFGMGVSDLGRVNDVMARGMTSAKVSFTDITQALEDAGPVARKVGLSFEETVAVIGQLGNVGITGSKAGIAIGAALSSLQNPSAEAVKALNRLGIAHADLFNDNGTMKPFANLVEQFQSSGAKMGDVMTIFGEEAGRKMVPLIDRGADSLRNLTRTIEDNAGAAKDLADKNNKGLIGGINSMTSAFEALALAIGDAGILHWAAEAVQGFAAILKSLSETNPMILRWGTVLAIVAAAVGPVIMGLGMLGFGLQGLVVGFAAVKAATLALSGALVATPVGWFLAAIAAIAFAGYAIYDNWNDIVGYFRGIWDGVKAAFSDGILNGITAVLVAFNPATLLADAINGMVNWLFGIDLKAVGSEWMSGLGAGLREALPDLSGMLSGALDMLPNKMKGLMGISSGPERPTLAPQGGRRSGLAPAVPLMGTSNRGAVAGEAQVGGRIEVVVQQDRSVRVGRVESYNRNVELDVDAGILMAGGA